MEKEKVWIYYSFFLRTAEKQNFEICQYMYSSDNLVGCTALRRYEWDGYDQLECIRANTGLLSA
jgi:hypothetical protein